MRPESDYLPYLDGWRGLAVALLLVGHFLPINGIDLGLVGVNLFFVLSGLLMTRVLFVKKTDIPTFYRRRIARILPSVAVFLLVTTAGYTAFGTQIFWSQVWAAATFTNNYFLGLSGERTLPFGHIWSLSVEEHSYIALSLLAILSRRRGSDGKLLIFLVSSAMAMVAIIYWVRLPNEELPRLWMHSEIAAFGIFSSGFLSLCHRQIDKVAFPAFATPTLLCVGICSHWWSVPYPFRTIVGCGCLALAVNLLGRKRDIVTIALEWAPLRKLGMWSFSIYIWQQLFYAHPDGTLLGGVLRIFASIIVGIAAYYLIEFPARKWLNNVEWRPAHAW
jgi:peptidoglycan/LPS O-acetylase OafA/YrhL